MNGAVGMPIAPTHGPAGTHHSLGQGEARGASVASPESASTTQPRSQMPGCGMKLGLVRLGMRHEALRRRAPLPCAGWNRPGTPPWGIRGRGQISWTSGSQSSLVSSQSASRPTEISTATSSGATATSFGYTTVPGAGWLCASTPSLKPAGKESRSLPPASSTSSTRPVTLFCATVGSANCEGDCTRCPGDDLAGRDRRGTGIREVPAAQPFAIADRTLASGWGRPRTPDRLAWQPTVVPRGSSG